MSYCYSGKLRHRGTVYRKEEWSHSTVGIFRELGTHQSIVFSKTLQLKRVREKSKSCIGWKKLKTYTGLATGYRSRVTGLLVAQPRLCLVSQSTASDVPRVNLAVPSSCCCFCRATPKCLLHLNLATPSLEEGVFH